MPGRKEVAFVRFKYPDYSAHPNNPTSGLLHQLPLRRLRCCSAERAEMLLLQGKPEIRVSKWRHQWWHFSVFLSGAFFHNAATHCFFRCALFRINF